jgi:AcrR family transcriptional regulator
MEPVGERLIRGRTLAERRQERREALLESALELFGTRGFAATTVDDVCRHANVSTRNFYEEYDNRLALLSALVDELAERALVAVIGVDIEPGPDFVARRTHVRVSALVHALVDDPRVARVVFVENVAGWAQYPDLMTDILGRFTRWLHEFWREHLDALGVAPARQRAFAMAVVGASVALLADWVRSPGERAPVDEVVDHIVELATVILLLPRVGDEAAG